jgi:hypothetical protein
VTRARLAAALPFVPAYIVVATWVVWATHDGGYFAVQRYPGALLAAALLLVLAIARPPGTLRRSPALLPLGLLAAWTAWNGLSIAWSSAPDHGWESTNALLTMVVMGFVLALTPWRAGSLMLLLGLWAAAIAVIAGVDLISFGTTSDPGARMFEFRYLGPIGYANGSAALGAMAFWPLLAIAADPRPRAAIRVLALPAGVLALAWALLPQSRGTIAAGLLVIPLFIAFSAHRVRVLTRLAVTAGALLICIDPLFDVYTTAVEKRPLDDVVETAVTRTGIAVLVTLAASLVLVAAERGVRPSERTLSWTRRAGVVATIAIVLGAAGVAVARQQHIRSGVSDRWHTFSSFADVVNPDSGARIGQVLPDKRYDYWKVALREFRDAPLIGSGVGSFQVTYAANKRYPKDTRYVHNLWLRALSDTGVIGTLLLLAALASGVVALIRGRLRGEPAAFPLIAATATLATAFFIQCTLDWLEEVPALLMPAVGFPLAAMRAAAPARKRRLAWPIPAAVAVIALVVMTPPYLAERNLDRGNDLRASDPQEALKAYDRAAGLNPLAVEPLLNSGFVGLQLRDAALARGEFERALDRREDWTAHFELGLLNSQAGKRRAARAELERASQLNRNDPIVLGALKDVEDGKKLDPLEVNEKVATTAVAGVTPP